MKADIKYDVNRNTFFTSYPWYSPSDYNALCEQVLSLLYQGLLTKMGERKMHNQISSYLKTLNTYLSHQLLEDIEKNGFYSYILILGLTPTHYNNYESLRDGFSNNPKIKAVDIDECAFIFIQMMTMVKTCWNSGIYGKLIHRQLINHLKSLNTSAAQFFLDFVVLSSD